MTPCQRRCVCHLQTTASTGAAHSWLLHGATHAGSVAWCAVSAISLTRVVHMLPETACVLDSSMSNLNQNKTSSFSENIFMSVCRVKIDYRPVHMKPLDSEMDFVPPKPRVY